MQNLLHRYLSHACRATTYKNTRRINLLCTKNESHLWHRNISRNFHKRKITYSDFALTCISYLVAYHGCVYASTPDVLCMWNPGICVLYIFYTDACTFLLKQKIVTLALVFMGLSRDRQIWFCLAGCRWTARQWDQWLYDFLTPRPCFWEYFPETFLVDFHKKNFLTVILMRANARRVFVRIPPPVRSTVPFFMKEGVASEGWRGNCARRCSETKSP